MRHLSDGILRRMQDEPLSTTGAEKDHYMSCERCRQRAMTIATEAERIRLLMAVPDEPLDPQRALRHFSRGASGQRAYAPTFWNRARRAVAFDGGRSMRPVAALALAAIAAVTLVATGVAENFVKVFEPSQFQAVQVRPDELRGLPDLSQFGTMTFSQVPGFTPVPDASTAASEAGLALKAPQTGAIPKRAQGTPSYVVMSTLSASFTFSAAKAQAWAGANGKTLPTMPPGLDGSTLSVSAGPGVIAVYGGSGALVGTSSGRQTIVASSTAPGPAGTGKAIVAGESAAQGRSNSVERNGSAFDPSSAQIPTMAVVQMHDPVVSSTGASVTEIEDYLISLPGFPQDLAAQIRAIGDPSTTLPVPVPTGQQSHQVDVNGVSGLFVGDSTGLGSGLVWSQGGILYATVGTLTEDEVTGVARSLH